LSDLCYLVVYKLFGYRTEVVDKNLKIAFPDKSTAELASIKEKFYRNFFDIIFETIKLLVISEAAVKKVMAKGKTSALDELYARERSVIIAGSHLGNWEYGSVSHEIYYRGISNGVYKSLSNGFFDQLMFRIRSRFKVDMWTIEDTLDKVRQNLDKHIAVGLLSDQNPSSHSAKWLPFFGLDTPVYTGLELMAKRFDLAVVYVHWKRLGRGRYEFNSELITEHPKEEGKFEITRQYLSKLERDIKENPDNWLWTHNRWKRVKQGE
jgi:KDO2-lipid IV(A) lauroyltransferase